MRIMCGAVILLVYISDSQNQFGSHASQTGTRPKEQREGNYLVSIRQTQEHRKTHQHRNTPDGYSVVRNRNRHKSKHRENGQNTTLIQGDVKREQMYASQPFTRRMFSVLKNSLTDSTTTRYRILSISTRRSNGKVKARYVLSKNPANSFTVQTRRKIGANSASFSSRVPHSVDGTQHNPPNADITTKSDRVMSVIESGFWGGNTPRRKVRQRRQLRTQKTQVRRSVRRSTRPWPITKLRRSQISKSRASSASSFSSSLNFSGNSNTAGFAAKQTHDSIPPSRHVVDEEPPSSDLQLSDPINMKKVIVLILATFLPGFTLGYLVIALIYMTRHKRCLCLMEGCEGAFNKLLRLTPPRTSSGSFPRLSMLEVSQRRATLPYRPPNIDIDRNLLENQFHEDRLTFQRTGKDPYYEHLSDVDPQTPFKDSPDMTRKEWLRGRLGWWLMNDRRRSLRGIFADPSGPPDDSLPPEQVVKEKYVGRDITSASIQYSSDSARKEPFIKASDEVKLEGASNNLFKAMVSNKESYAESVKSDDATSVDDANSVDSGEGSAVSDDK